MTDRDELVRTVPRRALVLVDVQNEYARLPLRIRYPRLRDCLGQIERALDAAEKAGLPVVCVRWEGLRALSEHRASADPAVEARHQAPRVDLRGN